VFFTPVSSCKYPRCYSTWTAWAWRWRLYNTAKCQEPFTQRHNVTYLEDLILQPLSVLSLLFVIFSIYLKISLPSSLTLRSMHDLGLLQDQFPGFSISKNIFLQPLTPIFFRSFSTSSKYLFLAFPGKNFLSEISLNNFLTILAPYANKCEKWAYQVPLNTLFFVYVSLVV